MIILKNAYVFNFNKYDYFGRYSLLINDNKVSDIADSSPKGAAKLEKWLEQYTSTAEIIDCSLKILMPPFINSCVKSEGLLIHYLLKSRGYENTENDLCTDLIFNYLYQELPAEPVKNDLKNIYNYSYNRQLKSGITSFNEFSLRKDTAHLPIINNAIKNTGQNINVCYPIRQDKNTFTEYKHINPSYYLTQENFLTVYDISTITELKAGSNVKLFLEAAVSKDVTVKFRETFQKSLVSVLDEYGLIDENTSLINPLYLDYNDLKIIADKNANIIICPRDLNHFSARYFPIDDFIGHGINFSIGTGWLGEDLFKDVRLFRNKYKELNLSSIQLLNAITNTPESLYFKNNDEDEKAAIDINRSADMIFIDLSDARFQFFPKDVNLESICDFIIDNLTSLNISDVMRNGKFVVKNRVLMNLNENEIITNVNSTRENLYKVGKYEELKKKNITREKSQKLDMTGRTNDEIKMFSDIPEENIIIDSTVDSSEEFRIKAKIPVFKPKVKQGQRNLFDDFDNMINNAPAEDFQETPSLNLLVMEQQTISQPEEEVMPVKSVDEKIISNLNPVKKPDKSKNVNPESKVELPKNVKLKFGDD